MNRANFQAFKELFKETVKPKVDTSGYLSAKGLCHAAIAQYEQKKFSTIKPFNAITLLAERKLRDKYPQLPGMSTTAGGTLGAGIGYFLNKELGIPFHEQKAKESLTRSNIIDKHGDIDPDDQSTWKKNAQGDLTPRNRFLFTKQDVLQAIQESIVEYAHDYATKYSQLTQASTLSRSSSIDSGIGDIEPTSRTPRSSNSSLSSTGTIDTNQDETDEPSTLTP